MLLQYKKFIVIVYLVFITTKVYAQSLKFISVSNQLSDYNYTCIVQDFDGFIWFGSRNGLIRFDGYNTKIYRSNNGSNNTINANWVTDIVADKQGKLWIATFGGGLNVFDTRTERFAYFTFNPSDSLSISSNTLLKLLMDSEGNLWIGAENGLNKLNRKTGRIERFTRYVNSYISSLAEDDNNQLWIGTTGKGLYRLNYKTFQIKHFTNQPTNPKSLSDNNIRSLLFDTKGNLWIGTNQNGLSKFMSQNNLEYFENFLYEKTSSNNTILTIYEDSRNRLWIGTENGGLNLFNRTKNSFMRVGYYPDDPEHSIQSNSIWSICEDAAGALWIATFNKGIFRYDPYWEKFSNNTKIQHVNENFSNTTVTSFLPLTEQSILIGTDGKGAYIWNMKNNSLRNLNTQNGMLSNTVLTANYDKNNNINIGTWGGGLAIWKPDESKVKSSIFVPENIFAITTDRANNYWIGTWGNGIFLIKANGNVKHLTSENPAILSSPNIFSILADSRNRVWIGTLYGLNKIVLMNDTFQVTQYFHKLNDSATLSSNTVISVFEDSKRNIWLGTSNGLNKFDEKSGGIIRIRTSTGFIPFEIKSITEDLNGNLWLGTDNGLLHYYPKYGNLITYDKSDGLYVNNFSVGAVARLNDGKLLFGGQKGFILFDPDSIIHNPYIPKPKITEIKIFGKNIDKSRLKIDSVNGTSRLMLSYKENSITFEYVALNYTHPEKNRYAYRLQGVDKDWIPAEAQRSVTYSSLKPGNYAFMVKAANNDGYWNEVPAILHISIKPPFWSTWWFRLFLILLLVSFIYLYIRFRLTRMHEKLELQQKIYLAEKAENEKRIMELKSEQLDSELKFKTRELESTTMHLIHKNEKLIEIRDKLLEIVQQTEPPIKNKISQLAKMINDELDDEKNWENFELNFNLIHDNFIKRFAEKYPDLTHNDLKMCALIRMNMSNKEIANLLNISIRSVESRRYRIRKRMNIDSDVNLNDYIIRF